MLDNCCAFTGHCPHKFPWRYDETDSRCVTLKTALTGQITRWTEDEVTDFYSGGADGVDCWASLIVLELRKKNLALKLHLILPHEGQRQPFGMHGSSAEESSSSIRSHLKLLKRADKLYPQVYILSVHEYPVPIKGLYKIAKGIYNVYRRLYHPQNGVSLSG